MRIYNPTPWDVKGKAGGVKYEVKANSEVDIWVDEHAIIFCRHHADDGIVHLAFTKGMQEKYKTSEEFKRGQAINGLNSIRRQFNRARVWERQAMREIKESKGAELDRETMDDGKFIKKIEEIDALIKALVAPPEVPITPVSISRQSQILAQVSGERPKQILEQPLAKIPKKRGPKKGWKKRNAAIGHSDQATA